MKGVILAGGEGTRLRPLTDITNKHLLPVYNQPMIDYPLNTLIDMGCDDIVIVSGGDHIGAFAEYLKSGERYGINLSYKVQLEAGGVAQALAQVDRITGLFPVILGDNYFELSPNMPGQPTIYTRAVSNPNRFGVYADGSIIEKPDDPASNQAVTGLYVYDERVFDMLATLIPSERGEYEITDVNNLYLQLGAQAIEYTSFWSDMGTFDSLLTVAERIYDHGN